MQREYRPEDETGREQLPTGPIAGREQSRVAEQQATSQLSTPMEDHTYAAQYGDGVSLLELLPIFLRRRWLFLGIITVVFMIGILYTAWQQRIYESTCSILVTSKQSSQSDDLPLLTDLQAITQARSVDTQIGILSSADLLQRAFANIPKRERQASFRCEKVPRWAVNIATKKNTDIIDITVNAYTPQGAAMLANSIAEIYFQQDLENNRKAVRQAREYVESRLTEVRQEFDAANLALAEYKHTTGMVSPGVQIDKMLENINVLQTDIDTTSAQTAANHQAMKSLQRQINEKQETALASITVSRNPRFNAIVQELDALYAERARLQQDYLPQSREMMDIDARLTAEKKQLAGITEMVVASSTKERDPVRDQLLQSYSNALANSEAYRAKLRQLRNAQANRQQAIKSLPALERQYGELMLTMKSKQNTVDFLAQKLQTLLISEQSTLTNGHLIATAQPNTRPIHPSVTTNITLSLVIGIILALLLMLLIGKFDERLYDLETVATLTGLPIMGSIHALEKQANPVILPGDHSSLLLERFRILRNNLNFTSIRRPRLLLAVTSVQSGEGKTFCASNLAVAMARDGKRVLLVDADLHRPAVQAIFQLSEPHGLVDVLMDTCSLETAIQPSEYDRLSILSAGSLLPDSSEVLNSPRCRQLFGELTASYDCVILDCPPCLQLSDIQVIATFVDGLLLVVGMSRNTRSGLLQTYQMLNMISAPLIGTVINFAPMSRKNSYYLYHQSQSPQTALLPEHVESH